VRRLKDIERLAYDGFTSCQDLKVETRLHHSEEWDIEYGSQQHHMEWGSVSVCICLVPANWWRAMSLHGRFLIARIHVYGKESQVLS
jgi:hypothetical protein